MTHVDSPQGQVRFAAVRADITPPLGIYWRMWGAATHDHATGVHRPLTATAAVFEPQENKDALDRLGIPEAERKFLGSVKAQFESEMDRGNRLALVSLDHCLLGKDEAALVISNICKRCSLLPSQVLLTFT